MASDKVMEFTDDNFGQEVVSSDSPVLVDFWAEWCMPCRTLAPTIDELASEFEGRVKVGKVDIDKHQNVSMEHKISAIPTILIFKGGEVAKKFVGLASKGDIQNALNELVD